MTKLFFVGLGGCVGAISRYIVSGGIYRLTGQSWLPYGTLGVNVLGCFFLGFLSGLSESRQIFTPEIRLLVFIGFFGSFTTFSTFGYESFTLARDGQMMISFLNVMLHLLFGFGAVWFGSAASKLL